MASQLHGPYKKTSRQTSLSQPARPSGGRRPGGRPGKEITDPDLRLLPFTLVTAILAWLLGIGMYMNGIEETPRPLLIGLIFTVLYLLLVTVVLLYSKIRGFFTENPLTGSPALSQTILSLVLLGALVFAAGTGFQFLYQLSFRKGVQSPTSYVFVLDDSGSMVSNDPDGRRYTAISHVLAQSGRPLPYVVYNFADTTELVSEMQTDPAAVSELSGSSYGMTNIRDALETVWDDYRSGVWDGGRNPRIVLMTDGYATDIDFFGSIDDILKDYAREGITISTVGLGDVDTGLMTQIATSTGGVFIDVSDAASLGEAMHSAASWFTTRDLLSTRVTSTAAVWYGFLRILFVTLLGIGIGLGATIAYGYPRSSSLLLLTTAIKSFVGACVMELGTSLFHLSSFFAWFLLWLCIAVTIAVKPAFYRGGSRNERV